MISAAATARVMARIVARVRGLTVVLVSGLGAFVIFASLDLPTWEKIVGYSVIGFLLVLAALKLFISGEEGPTDFHTPRVRPLEHTAVDSVGSHQERQLA